MKKKIAICLLAFTLVGCSTKNESSVTEETSANGSVPISETDFDTEDARNLFSAAMKEHCNVLQQSCTLGKVSLQGDTIHGSYTYTVDETVYTATGTLENVKVLSNNTSIADIGRKVFEDGQSYAPTAEADTEEVTDSSSAETAEKNPDAKFDLPDTEPTEADANGKVVLEEDGLKIRTMHIGGSFGFRGSNTGGNPLHIYALSLDQTKTIEIVSLDGVGDFDETADFETGWYYVVIEASGEYSVSWYVG